MKKYRVHFEQMNEMWLEIEASSKEAAINKSRRQARDYYPYPDCIELPNGNQEPIEN